MSFTEQQVAARSKNIGFGLSDAEARAGMEFARFWASVAVSSSVVDCWEWRGRTGRGGYGIISVAGRNQRASRIAYEMVHGPILPALIICHSCDNPACVNPMHLRADTPRSNTREMVAKGRNADRRGEKHPMARLAPDDIKAIRSLARIGWTQKAIGARYGIGPGQVGKIVRRENWSHIE